MKFSAVIIALLVVASWGFNAAIGKIGVTEYEPIAFLALRFFLTALIFMPFASAKREDYPLLLLIALLLNVGHMGSVFIAFKHLPASSVTVLQQSQVPFAVIIACLFAKEKVSTRQIVGILTAISGVVCIFGVPDLNLTGAFFALLASLFWAVTQLAFKRSKNISAYTFMAYTALFSCPFLVLESFLFESGQIEKLATVNYGRFLGSLAYEVLAMAAAMMIWQRLIAENGVNKLAPFTLLQVLFGIAGGIIFFNETISSHIIFGAALTIGGVGMTMLRRRQKHREEKREEQDRGCRRAA